MKLILNRFLKYEQMKYLTPYQIFSSTKIFKNLVSYKDMDMIKKFSFSNLLLKKYFYEGGILIDETKHNVEFASLCEQSKFSTLKKPVKIFLEKILQNYFVINEKSYQFLIFFHCE